ncbi:ThiF family adenylyltransferase [Sphingomonas sp. URHD0057]|uniref:ThiF family adenylyltransferase n=1 Tax=Sphingomonas sp. URHD0057 TaxID=1380389 RepID=UPI0009DCA34B|nr:ThiF family adenylyltransferase [Sphingomonas sp. URHD0057]
MDWLSRQSFLGSNSSELLGSARVGVVGLGGGGSHVCQQLGHVGIGEVVIVDPDRISSTNLNRLIGGTRLDVLLRRKKTSIAKRQIRRVNATARVISFSGEWQACFDILKACDIIVGCLDQVRAKDELDAFCRRYLIPFIDIGMDVHEIPSGHLIAGQVALSFVGGPCLRCLGIVTETAVATEARNYGAAGGNPQVVWPNGVLASTAVGLIIQMLNPWQPTPVETALLQYDGNIGTVSESHRLANWSGRCQHYPADQRGDPGFRIRERHGVNR